jgi:pyruvate dehydrogenase E1 component
MGEVVDGEFQKYTVESGAYIRQHFFGKHPELLRLVEHLSDEQLRKLSRGGHDPEKVYAAFKAAVEHRGTPTVILAHTVKGYGLGEAGEGRNITHQQKKLNEEELKEFRTRFNIPISDDDVASAPFYKPAEDSREMRYLKECRQKLGGFLPARRGSHPRLPVPPLELFTDFLRGSGNDGVTSTAAFVGVLRKLLADPQLGKWIVPIIPDEARTFGMDPLFSQIGIYSNVGQNYEPVDANTLKAYRERKDGQLLEEGITEAGSMSSFIAAGTAYATHGIPSVPFFIFYSMFGFQRIGDLIWAAADMRTRGFLLGGTAGRTTLNGEGLQHEDGHSHVLASTVPTLAAYDPAYAYELAIIVREGMRRMFEAGEDVMYYITLYNEKYPMPPMPEGAAEGVIRGMYKLKPATPTKEASAPKSKVALLGSGPILREALRAQQILADNYSVAADVWSVTSYKELRREALDAARWNMLHPTAPPRKSYVEQMLTDPECVYVAASDYLKALPGLIARWVPGGLVTLGTDGFGRSDSRAALRRHFEVDAECITLAALWRLAQRGDIRPARVEQAIKDLGIDPDKGNPMVV